MNCNREIMCFNRERRMDEARESGPLINTKIEISKHERREGGETKKKKKQKQNQVSLFCFSSFLFFFSFVFFVFTLISPLDFHPSFSTVLFTTVHPTPLRIIIIFFLETEIIGVNLELSNRVFSHNLISRRRRIWNSANWS